MDGLIHSDSTGNYIHPRVVEHYSLNVYNSNSSVSMASALLSVEITGYCKEILQVNGCDYKVHLEMLPDCCADVVSRQDFQKLYDSATYGKKHLYL